MGGSDSTKTEPWQTQQQYLLDIFQQAQGQSRNALPYFPGGTVAGRSAAGLEGEQAGLGLIRGTDRGSLGAADAYNTRVLGGEFMSPDSNPWLRNMADVSGRETTRHFQRAVAPMTYMSGAGRGGSGAEMNLKGRSMEALAQELYEGQTGLFGRHYGAERGRMGQAAGMAPGLAAGRRADITTGYGLGQGAEQYDQRLLNDLIQRFEYGRDEPSMRLGRYSDIIQGRNWGSESTVNRGFGASEGAGIGVGLLGALAAFCSRGLKDEIDEVNSERILQNIEKLPLAIWKYKDEVDAFDHEPHMGPYAEDVQRLFGLGNDKQIFLMDAVGIALAGIQALSERNQELTKRVATLEAQLLPQTLEEVG